MKLIFIETDGKTGDRLTMGDGPIADGDVLIRDGRKIVGASRTRGGVTTLIDTTPYDLNNDEELIFCDTDLLAITVNLPAGTDGKHFRIANVEPGNDVTLVPDGLELLFGINGSQTISPGEILNIYYEPIKLGWW